MRKRSWVGTVVVIATLLGASPSAAQDLPDDGPIASLELVGGDVLLGDLVRPYYAKGADVGADYEGFVLLRASGDELFVPERVLSDAQLYWNRRHWYYPPRDHPIFDDPKRPRLPVTAMVAFALGEAALRAGPRLHDHARRHFEHALALAASDDDAATDAATLRAEYVDVLAKHELHVSTVDGRWVDTVTYHTERGWKRWGDEWVPSHEYDRRLAARGAETKRSLAGMVDAPERHARVHLRLVRAFPGQYAPDARGAWPLVSFFATFAALPQREFDGWDRFRRPAYLRLQVSNDDCDHVYVATGHAALVARAHAFAVGDRVEVFGRLILDRGLVIVECQGLALR